jgi:ribonuclease HI
MTSLRSVFSRFLELLKRYLLQAKRNNSCLTRDEGQGIDFAENKNKVSARWLATHEGKNAFKNIQFFLYCYCDGNSTKRCTLIAPFD